MVAAAAHLLQHAGVQAQARQHAILAAKADVVQAIQRPPPALRQLRGGRRGGGAGRRCLGWQQAGGSADCGARPRCRRLVRSRHGAEQRLPGRTVRHGGGRGGHAGSHGCCVGGRAARRLQARLCVTLLGAMLRPCKLRHPGRTHKHGSCAAGLRKKGQRLQVHAHPFRRLVAAKRGWVRLWWHSLQCQAGCGAAGGRLRTDTGLWWGEGPVHLSVAGWLQAPCGARDQACAAHLQGGSALVSLLHGAAVHARGANIAPHASPLVPSPAPCARPAGSQRGRASGASSRPVCKGRVLT